MFGAPNPASTMPDLASLLSTIQNLYPQARITSGYRGPNNPLTLRNPASLHAQGSPEDPRAVDVAPIPGVSFNDYVSSVKKAGVPISQAFDEASHPFAWTTGPNWHLAEGSAPMPQATIIPKKKPQTLADLATPPLGGASVDQPTLPDQINPPQTLADLVNSGPPVDTKTGKTKNTIGNVLGILGDALMAYGGLKPEFAPMMQQQAQDDRQAALAQQRLNAEVEAAQAKATEPPAAMQTAIWFSQQDPATQARLAQSLDTYDPKTTIGPQGVQIVPRVQTKTIGNRTFHYINGQWFEEGQ